ncbi:MAG: class I SAM-dependent methyltransferase [bacterium]|nr:class I SAM-dependent methyltransferase [bacterium]
MNLKISFSLPRHCQVKSPIPVGGISYWAQYFLDCAREITNLVRYGNVGRGVRNQHLVKKTYEKIWGLGNEAWVRQMTTATYKSVFANQELITNKWFGKNIYLQIVSQLFDQLDCRSVLEVGSGRGDNITLLSFQNPKLKLTGLELSRMGTQRSQELITNFPKQLISDFFGEKYLISKESLENLKQIKFFNGDATQMDFPDNSFDATFTIMVLEQMPHSYPKALEEICRVTKKYCIFLEPFREANGFKGRLHLNRVDYFRSSYKEFQKFGLEPIFFYKDYPQKVTFGTGILVARVVK